MIFVIITAAAAAYAVIHQRHHHHCVSLIAYTTLYSIYKTCEWTQWTPNWNSHDRFLFPFRCTTLRSYSFSISLFCFCFISPLLRLSYVWFYFSLLFHHRISGFPSSYSFFFSKNKNNTLLRSWTFPLAWFLTLVAFLWWANFTLDVVIVEMKENDNIIVCGRETLNQMNEVRNMINSHVIRNCWVHKMCRRFLHVP